MPVDHQKQPQVMRGESSGVGRAGTLTQKGSPVQPRQVESLVVVRSNDLTFVDDVVTRLQTAGIMTWLFGGWAEELLGLAAPREHRDLDLLHLAADFGPVDDFMTADGRVTEIAGKRFPHKRAFLHEGIMVELILVRATCSDGFCTLFWGDTLHRWPDYFYHNRRAACRQCCVFARVPGKSLPARLDLRTRIKITVPLTCHCRRCADAHRGHSRIAVSPDQAT